MPVRTFLSTFGMGRIFLVVSKNIARGGDLISFSAPYAKKSPAYLEQEVLTGQCMVIWLLSILNKITHCKCT